MLHVDFGAAAPLQLTCLQEGCAIPLTPNAIEESNHNRKPELGLQLECQQKTDISAYLLFLK